MKCRNVGEGESENENEKDIIRKEEEKIERKLKIMRKLKKTIKNLGIFCRMKTFSADLGPH